MGKPSQTTGLYFDIKLLHGFVYHTIVVESNRYSVTENWNYFSVERKICLSWLQLVRELSFLRKPFDCNIAYALYLVFRAIASFVRKVTPAMTGFSFFQSLQVRETKRYFCILSGIWSQFYKLYKLISL